MTSSAASSTSLESPESQQLAQTDIQHTEGEQIDSVPTAVEEKTVEAKELSNEPLTFVNSPKIVLLFEDKMPVFHSDEPKPNDTTERPVLSLVVIVYDMPEQAKKTLYSFSAKYQIGVKESDYEVIVVENESKNTLSKHDVEQFGSNFSYHLRAETEPTPVHAINFGASLAKGAMIGIAIDGARMATPGLVSYVLAARRLSANAIVAVPGYHLGRQIQQEAVQKGYNTVEEQKLLASIFWPQDGYRLFDIAVLSATSAGGYFKPAGESNCFCMSRELWEKVGGCDPRFNATGGGQVNLDLYKRVVELPETILIVLPGEGTFHQLHGGVTTALVREKRKAVMDAHFTQYTEIRGEPYSPPKKRAIYLGAFPDNAMKLVQHSAMMVRRNRGDISYKPAELFGIE